MHTLTRHVSSGSQCTAWPKVCGRSLSVWARFSYFQCIVTVLSKGNLTVIPHDDICAILVGKALHSNEGNEGKTGL